MAEKFLTDFKSGYAYAIRLLYRADYTSKMIEDRLARKGLPRDIAREITEKLKKDGYTDDLDYGRKFIEDACNLKGKGIKYIEFELSKRGLTKDEISSLLEEYYRPDIKKSLDGILRKLNKSLEELDYKELSSVKAKLIRKGYTFDEISGVLSPDFNDL